MTFDTASNGTKAWVTNLKGEYNNSESSFLESPCFNFTSAEYPVISFDYWIKSEADVDGFVLEYSINGGSTWLVVPENTNHSSNWWTGTTVTALSSSGWSGNSGGYITAKTLLPIAGGNKVTGVNNVKFRFRFASNDSNTSEGVSIDNVKIFELPYDVGILSLTSPVSGCLIGNNQTLVATAKNFGYRPLKVGLKVPIEVKLRNENIVKDTLQISSQIDKDGTTTYSSTGTYNIFNKGTHSLRINTNFAQELDRTNDTLKTTLEVKGIPGYTLGADRAYTSANIAAGQEIDAGQNGTVDYNGYLWSTTETTRKITVNSYGTYSVTVTNESVSPTCTSTDAIDIIPATNDVEIVSVSNLKDSCIRKQIVYPEIVIKNNGPDNIGPTQTMTTIPLSIMVDGVVVVPNENFTPSTDINSGQTATYTFTNGLNLSSANSYDIRIYSKINADPNKSNDTLKVTANVWGMPDVNFAVDTIASQNATSLVLDAGPGFATYSWENSTITTQTYNVPVLTSAWYVVNVTDSHSCGSDKDSVYVNAKDLTVDRIDSPSTAFCDNENSHVTIMVRNSGKDNIIAGSILSANYITPNESISQNFTLPLLTPEATTSLEFTNPVNLPLGTGFIKVTVNIADDSNPSNNLIEKSFEKLAGPSVYFNPSTLYKVFTDPYVLSPVYSLDVKSFQWKDNSMNDISYDSLYTIIGTPPSKILHVIAYDKLGLSGCRDTASLSIISEDVAVDAIKSPTNQCVFSNNVPITISIANRGNFAYPAGTLFSVGINVDGTLYPTEDITLSTSLDPNSKMDVTLTPQLNLVGKTSSNIQISISTALDAITSNNILNKTVYATGYPTINLGADRTIHAWSDTLRATDKFNAYEWRFNNNPITPPAGIDSVLVATQSGAYQVTVTDYNGCSSYDIINLTFVVDDISLKTLLEPISKCGLESNEAVKLTIQNSGTELIPSGKQLKLGFRQNGVEKNENISLANNLAANETLDLDLTNTMDFTNKTIHPIKVWVNMVGDMRNNNDTISTSVNAYPPVFFSFGADTLKPKGADTTLNVGNGYATYLWNTGATTSTLLINKSGKYSVEVANSDGCTDKDSVYVKIGVKDISIKSMVSPQNSCELSSSETIVAKIENSGSYNDLPIGTVIPLTLKVDGVLVASENFTLTSALNSGSSIDYSFTYKPNLSTVGNYTLEISSSLTNDEVSSNNTLSQVVSNWGKPIVDLGQDRTITSQTILDAGPGFTSYTWQDNSHNQTFTVSATGKYSVTVIDSHGCQGYDEVNITWQEVSDIRVSSLVTPATYCFKPDGQTITVELKNEGSKTYTNGESFQVSYQVGSANPVVETCNVTSNFANGQKFNFSFTQKAIINPGATTLNCKTIISGIDGQLASYPVTVNALPALNFTSDTIRTTLPYVLNSGISGVTYLWNTGSTSASISVSAYGKYKLTVTNPSTGCTAQDSVVIYWPVSVETINGTNTKVHLYPNPVRDNLKIKIESDKADLYKIELINPQGQITQTLKSDKVINFEGEISVGNYTPGIYIVRVSNSVGSALFKVIVQ